ncbi:MAG: hypothetical protein L0H54_11500, partial [Alcaligenaceae bacterium]|nr:hypothetical protein [Alcaligenaceae bacterium]
QADHALDSVERAGALIDNYGTQLVRGAYLCLSGDAMAGRDQPGRAVAYWQQAIVESRRLGLSLYARRAEERINRVSAGEC